LRDKELEELLSTNIFLAANNRTIEIEVSEDAIFKRRVMLGEAYLEWLASQLIREQEEE
jgi:hypothetical protein